MAIGQAVPSTLHAAARAKVSDGKSVKVTVPAATTIEAAKFYLLDGFLGAAMTTVTTAAGETAETVLDIDLAEYETDQIDTTRAFAKGGDIYWDTTNNRFTTTATANTIIGRVTASKDADNVVWFKRTHI